MKKTMLVLVLAGTLLIVNAVVGSSFLNNMIKSEKISYQDTLSTPIVPILFDRTSTENLSSVPNLITEPEISTISLKDYFAEVVTQEDIELFYNWADNSHNAKSLETRELTDEESKRKLVLSDKYEYDSLRPEKPLPLVFGDYDFYFDIKNDTYHYPEREMTDEEILQWIDNTAKINYALGLRYELFNTNPKPSSKDITEEEALTKAKISLKKIFDFDVDKSSLSTFISFSTVGPTEKGEWSIFLSPYKMNTLLANGETYWTYNVSVDSLTGDVVYINGRSSSYQRTSLTTDTRNDILEDDNWVHTAKSIVTDKIGETRKIKNIFIDNKYYGGLVVDGTDPENIKWVEEKSNEAGMVFVVVELEDASKYIITLFNPDKALCSVSYDSNNSYKN